MKALDTAGIGIPPPSVLMTCGVLDLLTGIKIIPPPLPSLFLTNPSHPTGRLYPTEPFSSRIDSLGMPE